MLDSMVITMCGSRRKWRILSWSRQWRFLLSVDMTAASCACSEMCPDLSPDARCGSYERLPNPATSCHQTVV